LGVITTVVGVAVFETVAAPGEAQGSIIIAAGLGWRNPGLFLTIYVRAGA